MKNWLRTIAISGLHREKTETLMEVFLIAFFLFYNGCLSKQIVQILDWRENARFLK